VYDDDGNVKMGAWLSVPFAGTEGDLKKDDEHILCMRGFAGEKERQRLLRAEPVGRLGAVKTAVAQANAWKLLARERPDDMKAITLATFDAARGLLAVAVAGKTRGELIVVDSAVRQVGTFPLTKRFNHVYFDGSQVLLRRNQDRPWPWPIQPAKAQPPSDAAKAGR